MLRTLITAIGLSIATVAFATTIDPTPLDRQVERAATIVVGRVESVTIHDRAGRELQNITSRTGPGEPNELRLHVILDATRVLKGKVPDTRLRLSLPLWKMWHNDLEGAREAYGKKDFVFFLSADLRPADEAVFFHFDSELPAIRAEIAKSKRPNKAPEPTPKSVPSPSAQEPSKP